MKHRSETTLDRLNRWLLSLLGLGIVVAPGAAAAADEAEDTTPEEAPVLSPEEFYEGGANAYDNWIELAVGGYSSSGNENQFRQRYRTGNDVVGGIQDFHYKRDLGKDVIFQMDGRALFDNEDYKVTLDFDKWDLGYVKFGYEQFRTWSNADGGYDPTSGQWFPSLGEALELDRGECFFEAGLRLENVPKVTFRYSHRFREGQKGSTHWGAVDLQPGNPNAAQFRNVQPAVRDIDEAVDTVEIDVEHRVKATDLGMGARFETGDLDNTMAVQSNGPSHREGTSYDFLSVHAFTETWIKENLFFSSGFLFSDLDNGYTGSRTLPGTSYTSLDGGAHSQEYVLNLNLMAQPWKHVAIVPSLRVEKEDWNADGDGLDGGGQLFTSTSSRDSIDVRERLEARYTGVTNWVFYARAEFTQGDGELEEDGLNGLPVSNQPGVERRTDDSRFFQDYTAGFNWYPQRRMRVDLQGYHRIRDYDYDHRFVNPTSGGGFYPAHLVEQALQTSGGKVRLTVRPSLKVTSVTQYDLRYNTIDAQPDPVAGFGEVETSRTISHVLAQNLSWAPLSRLFVQAGFNYVISETVSPASDYTQAILDARNDYWTVNLASTYVLSDKTDLSVGYYLYQANNDDLTPELSDGAVAVPYGAGATEHGLSVGVSHRLNERVRLNLRYGFAHYEDDTSGGNLDYEAHMVYGSVQYRF